MGALRRALVEQGCKLQLVLPAQGSHPGPLFGPLPIKKPGKGRLRAKMYDKMIKEHTPPWADKAKIREFYKEAKRRTLDTGEPWTVDHIVPLNGETVSGLHWHGNMQLLPKLVNMVKGNKFIEQLGLFCEGD